MTSFKLYVKVIDTLKSLSKRYLALLIGLTIMAASVAMAKLSGLGTSPISSVPNVLSIITPLTIGQTTIVFNTAIIVLEAVVLGRHFTWLNVLQIIPTVIFGELIDVFVSLFAPWAPHTYWLKIVLILVATLLLAFGVFLEVSSSTIMMAGEGIAAALAFRLKRLFGSMKVRCDIAMVCLAVVLAWVFYHHQLVGVREGTVIAAVLTGLCVGLMQRRLSPLVAWLKA